MKIELRSINPHLLMLLTKNNIICSTFNHIWNCIGLPSLHDKHDRFSLYVFVSQFTLAGGVRWPIGLTIFLQKSTAYTKLTYTVKITESVTDSDQIHKSVLKQKCFVNFDENLYHLTKCFSGKSFSSQVCKNGKTLFKHFHNSRYNI